MSHKAIGWALLLVSAFALGIALGMLDSVEKGEW